MTGNRKGCFQQLMLAIIKLVLTEANHTSEKVAIEDEKVAIGSEKVTVEKLTGKAAGKSLKHFEKLYCAFGTEGIFGRNDVAGICGLSYSVAGKIIVRLKEYELIEEVKGKGKGKGTVPRFGGSVPFCFDEIKSIYR